MSWRLDIKHVTRYLYDRPVVASYNEARVTPLTTADQIVIDARVTVSPAADTQTYWDYWGAYVHVFDVHDAHDVLEVTSTALVETGATTLGRAARAGAEAGRDATLPLTWRDLQGARVTDRFYEYLATSRLVGPGDFGRVAENIRAQCPSPADAVPAVVEWAHGQLEYGAGTTHVGTSAAEAWRGGRGVCQDFSHLGLAVLRAMGIPARYVSGYFYPKKDGGPGTRVIGESHAWLEAWTGGWSAWDPTNLVSTDQRHVVVARGRDYADVAPLRGIYSGPPGTSTEVSVELTRRA